MSALGVKLSSIQAITRQIGGMKASNYRAAGLTELDRVSALTGACARIGSGSLLGDIFLFALLLDPIRRNSMQL
jgi:hypothetical protein